MYSTVLALVLLGQPPVNPALLEATVQLSSLEWKEREAAHSVLKKAPPEVVYALMVDRLAHSDSPEARARMQEIKQYCANKMRWQLRCALDTRYQHMYPQLDALSYFPGTAEQDYESPLRAKYVNPYIAMLRESGIGESYFSPNYPNFSIWRAATREMIYDMALAGVPIEKLDELMADMYKADRIWLVRQNETWTQPPWWGEEATFGNPYPNDPVPIPKHLFRYYD